MLESQSSYTQVVDGRVNGGQIKRHHGRPAAGRHAVQLEMAWRCYMQEGSPYAIDSERAAVLRPVLRDLMQALLDWKPDA